MGWNPIKDVSKVFRETVVRPVLGIAGDKTGAVDAYNKATGLKKPTAADAPGESAYSLGLTEELKSLALKRQIEQAMANGTGAVYNGRFYADPAKAKEAWAQAGGAGDIQYFAGLGDDALTKKYLDIGLNAADEQARRELKLRQELGVDSVRQTLKELEASDPEGYAAQKRIKAQLTGEVEGYDPEAGDLGALLRDARAEYALGAKLDASTANEVEQAARAAQAARGNVLGLGAAAQETMALGAAGEARKQQRAQALLGYDTTAYARKQQGLANASNYVLDNPISNQFGSLAGAGAGNLAYAPTTPTTGAGLTGQLGTMYQQNAFTQDNLKLQNKLNAGNPWLNMGMGVAGNFLGAYTGGLGSGMAASAFK